MWGNIFVVNKLMKLHQRKSIKNHKMNPQKGLLSFFFNFLTTNSCGLRHQCASVMTSSRQVSHYFPSACSHRYYYLAFRAHQMPSTNKENVVAILERAKLEAWVLGKTKVMWLSHQKILQKNQEICVHIIHVSYNQYNMYQQKAVDWDTGM